MMVDKDQLYADLKEVRQLLAKGWCQGQYAQVTPQGAEYCLRGAMRTVPCMTSHSDMSRAIGSQLEDPRHSIVTWNDEPERTQQDVLDLVDKTIANLDLIVLTWDELV